MRRGAVTCCCPAALLQAHVGEHPRLADTTAHPHCAMPRPLPPSCPHPQEQAEAVCDDAELGRRWKAVLARHEGSPRLWVAYLHHRCALRVHPLVKNWLLAFCVHSCGAAHRRAAVSKEASLHAVSQSDCCVCCWPVRSPFVDTGCTAGIDAAGAHGSATSVRLRLPKHTTPPLRHCTGRTGSARRKVSRQACGGGAMRSHVCKQS